jgi:hypothetical protein
LWMSSHFRGLQSWFKKIMTEYQCVMILTKKEVINK